jgi:FKBP-type peptidyl-prolyl cis-trans isomerase
MKPYFMKNFQFVILIFLSISLQAQQKPASAPAKPQVEIKLTNGVDSSQYILGAYLGQYLNANGIAITKPDLFIKGMDDVLTNKKLLVSADSIPKRMNEYMNQMVMERNRALEKQLFTNVKGQPGIGNLPDGVCYAIVKAGTGSRPLLTDSVSIHVKGYLPEGKIFEDTYTGNKPFRTTPATLIPGLKETLQIMPAGSLWRIYIPSALAYGEKGISGVIPPYSAVVFDIELLNIIK